ncbi:MAG: DUF3990 domain-containing protein [Treponema sp.]|nr:DUF3990 domain-containing protein [Treponema sp.]
MILFHGSNVNIQQIELLKCKPYKDFGKGFYLTTILEQAKRMALRTARMFGGTPCVNKYFVDDAVFSSEKLNIKLFENPCEEWAKFVIANRNYNRIDTPQEDNNSDNRYDIVIGPIANDDLALLFRQFTDGLISVETLIKEMKFKKLTNQCSFHTERAIALLKKDGVEYV